MAWRSTNGANRAIQQHQHRRWTRLYCKFSHHFAFQKESFLRWLARCVGPYGFRFSIFRCHFSFASLRCKLSGSLIHCASAISFLPLLLLCVCRAGAGRCLLPLYEPLILWSRVCILVANLLGRVCVWRRLFKYRTNPCWIVQRVVSVFVCIRGKHDARRLTLDVIEKVRLNNATAAFFKHNFYVNMGTTDNAYARNSFLFSVLWYPQLYSELPERFFLLHTPV